MRKYFVIWGFMGTYSSVKILKGYILTCWNAEGVHGKRKVGNPCSRESRATFNMLWSKSYWSIWS